MALAAFTLLKCTGSGAGAETDSSKHPCFLNADSNSIDTGNSPISAPITAGTYTYSYEVWLRWQCSAAPDNACQNFKFYGPLTQPDSEGDPGNKVTVMVGSIATGATPTVNASSVAITSQHDNYNSSGNALNFHSGVLSSIGDKTNYLVLQLKIAYGVNQGNLPTMTFNLTYEES